MPRRSDVYERALDIPDSPDVLLKPLRLRCQLLDPGLQFDHRLDQLLLIG